MANVVLVSPVPPIPPLAGRYVLADQVGAGGMGSVWRAWDLRQERFVAVKVLGQHDASLLLRFVREQSVRVRHPHVIAPHGWAADDDLVVLAMDLVRGGSLQSLLETHGPLPADFVAVVLDQLLQALAAVHAAGVVHRDVKPANLLLDATGSARPHVRLGDFGVAALAEDVRLTRTPGAVGTDGYMAPEQAAGEPPDPGQDLYAAGVVALQLLSGRAPTRSGPPPTPPPGRLVPLLDALTAHDPRRRPASAAAALGLLRRAGVPSGAPWRDGPRPPVVVDRIGPPPWPAPPGARAVSAPSRDHPPGRAHRWALGLAGAGCLGGAGGLAVAGVRLLAG